MLILFSVISHLYYLWKLKKKFICFPSSTSVGCVTRSSPADGILSVCGLLQSISFFSLSLSFPRNGELFFTHGAWKEKKTAIDILLRRPLIRMHTLAPTHARGEGAGPSGLFPIVVLIKNSPKNIRSTQLLFFSLFL